MHHNEMKLNCQMHVRCDANVVNKVDVTDTMVVSENNRQ